MGTNFYWIKKQKWMEEYKNVPDDFEEGDYSPFVHIGKRSGGGKYCYKCGITFCRSGERGIHFDGTWHDKCPACGGEGEYTCTFLWTMRRHEYEIRNLIMDDCEDKVIVDEYGEQFTASEFLAELDNSYVTSQHFAEFS